MADMYTPQEIQDIFERYNEAIRKNIPISESLAKEMADATKGVKNYTNTLNYNIKSLGTSFKTLSQDLNKGARGAAVFNNSIEATGEVISTIASRFGILGVAIGAAAKLFTMFVGSANKQSDKLFETFQNLSRTGSVGSQAMTDVFQGMKRFGYTLDELDKMTAVLAESSRDFAVFSGTAATGGKNLATLVDGFKDARVNLQALGLSTDEQVRAAAGYYKQMNRLGRATDLTSSGALAYIKEMEVLTRLTGLQRKELEDQRQAAEDIDTFYAALLDMDPKAAEEAYSVFNQLMSIDPSGKKARGFAASINGIVGGTEDQMESLYSTNFQMLEFAQQLKSGTINAQQYLQADRDARATNIELQKSLAKVGVTDMFGSLKNNVIQVNKGLIPFADQADAASKEVNDLWKAIDPATKAQAEARVAQINAVTSMQDFVNLGVTPATRAMAYFSEVVETLTSLLPGGKSKGYGRSGTGTMAGSLASTGGGALAGAATGAAIGSVVPGVGTIIGGAVGGIAGGLTGWTGYQMHGGEGDSTKGLRIKGGAGGQAMQGGEAMPGLYALAQRIQGQLGGDLGYFSSFNDLYHQGLDRDSAHKRGSALDFTLTDPSKAAQVAALIRGMPGVKFVKDEYASLSPGGTGGHIHAEIGGASGFRGMLSGPMSGYKPNITMHGTEELSIRPAGSGASTGASGASASEGTMLKLIEQVNELIYLSKNQLGVNEKILRYQQ